MPAASIYFMLLIMLIPFFAINLVLAVIFDEFGQAGEMIAPAVPTRRQLRQQKLQKARVR